MCCVQMWEDLIKKAKDGGLDVIDTYVFWNVHEPSPGNVLHFSPSLFTKELEFCFLFSILSLIVLCSLFFEWVSV